MLDKGAALDLQDAAERTALHTAVMHNDAEVVKFLLEKGANPNLPDAAGRTALHLAVLKDNDKNIEMMDLLFQKGALAKATDGDGNTFLHKAAERGNRRILEDCSERPSLFDVWDMKNNAGMTVAKTGGFSRQWNEIYVKAQRVHDSENTRRSFSHLTFARYPIGSSTRTKLVNDIHGIIWEQLKSNDHSGHPKRPRTG